MKTMADILRERGKLGPYTSPEPAPSAVDAATVRVWAAEAGVDCPPRGRVPASVLDAYLKAH